MPKRWDPDEVRENSKLVELLNGKKIRKVVSNLEHYAKPLTKMQLENKAIDTLIANGKLKDPEHTRLNRFQNDLNGEDAFRQKLKKYKEHFSNIKFNTNSMNSDKRYKILMEKL